MAELTRTFAALTIGSEDRESIARLSAAMRERQSGTDLKWVRPEIIHLTFRFFGDLDRKQLGKASDAIRSLDRDFAIPDVAYGELGAFPSKRRPQVIWLGVVDPRGELAALAARADMAIRRVGFGAADKPFVAHLTLARVGRGRRSPAWDLLTDGLTTPNGPLRITSVTLFKSDLRPQGPLYTPLEVARPREGTGVGGTAVDEKRLRAPGGPGDQIGTEKEGEPADG